MRKKIILPVSLIVLIAVGVFVFAETSEGEYNPAGIDGSVTLEKGWNLISIYGINARVFDIESEADEKSMIDLGIKAIYFYDRDNRGYMRLHPDRESDKVKDLISKVEWQLDNAEKRKEYAFLTNSVAWIYSEKEQTFNFHTIDGPFFINYFNLKQGWNFLSITPEMIGKYLNEIKGSCNVEKIYFWNPEEQKWEEFPLTENFDDEGLWMGIIIKVSSDCTLGETSSATSPPGLPSNLDDDFSCTDSDGGLNYNIKGTVTGQNEDDPTEQITTISDVCNGNTLYEWICKDSGKYDDEDYVCPNGCSDGACV